MDTMKNNDMKTMKNIEENRYEPIEMVPIGVIRTPYKQPEDTPKSGAEKPEVEGELVIDRRYLEAMADMAPGKQYMVLFCFDRSRDYKLTVPLRGIGPMTGLFSTHAPARPNPIGISIVTAVAITDNRVRFTGVDMLDGTPILDIKSY